MNLDDLEPKNLCHLNSVLSLNIYKFLIDTGAGTSIFNENTVKNSKKISRTQLKNQL